MDFSIKFHTGCSGVTHGLYFQSYILLHSLMIDFVLEKSADPDEMPPYAAFHLGLHCLPYVRSPQRVLLRALSNYHDSNATDSRLVSRISRCLLFYSALFNLLSIPLPGSFSLITLAFHHANAASTRQIINSFHLQANNVRIL